MGSAAATALLTGASLPAQVWTPAHAGGGPWADILALAVAGAALYLPGLAVALLLPAPRTGSAELRVAVAPLLSIVLAELGVRLLGWAGVGLHAAQLLVLTVLLWALVWWRRRAAPGSEPRGSWTDRAWLAATLGLGAAVWLATLVQAGLALPNRDFKNHAVYVAQIAATGSLDPAVVLRDSPAALTSSGVFYPLGLHGLLAWALPERSGSTVGVTAAAAVVLAVVSLPLAVRVLARMWCPDDERLPRLAGLVAVCLPGATAGAFAIGSVVLIAGVALYAAGLCVLWSWVREPAFSSALLVGLAVLGLFWLHVAEAVGLVLVACGLPALAEGRRVLRGRLTLMLLGASAVVALGLVVVLLREDLVRLLRLRDWAWDLQANDVGPLHALVGTLVQQPVPLSLMCGVWWALAVVGLLRGWSHGWSGLPALALLVPVILGVVAVMRLPAVLTAITAPWYGTTTRVMLLAFPVLVVVACAAMLGALEGAESAAMRAAVAAVVAVVVVASATRLVPDRRVDLAASLAGAGDTAAVATWLSDQLRDGGTVLNLEADGTPLLFAYARVPVLSSAGAAVVDEPVGGVPLSERLLDLGDTAVADRLAALDVRFVALGTANRYWGQSVGYDWRQVAAQPQLQLVALGQQLVVLRYQGDAS